jgi:hypothetical protein
VLEDKEREVIEQTRRNHSDIHAAGGNVQKFKARGSRKNYAENEVRNPIKAVAILLGTFLTIAAAVFIIDKIASLF